MQKKHRIHHDFEAIQQLVYEPLGLVLSNFALAAESQEYGACTFEVGGKRIVFRVAKITPTKIGQFVTFWKRIGRGPIMPFDIADPVDFFVISARDSQQFGLFVFPKKVLLEKEFVSKGGVGGKRAMRVYPSWDRPDSPQAQNTQAWQVQYFFELSSSCFDRDRVQKLFL